ncbi:HAMP domain-containing protein [Sulfuritortus calidifontis]|uniref:histidine kinase n=1 Tax=Sulfuritortus calidifontis TaxID=1914471 RepID=A0A4R3JXW5_9PROT|nr:HAMP domain-containing sensor histidine kinase [Sulfuritortus calidifontis]TCS72372.1 HAMP domain-containing protein [Sulfuritortus calidifontis]
MSSIRGKIALSYYLLAAVAVGFALFAYGDLRYLDRRIGQGVEVSAFREDVLEMRRHEKNYLLYRDASDLESAIRYAESARARLKQQSAFAELTAAGEIERLERQLLYYARLLMDYRQGPAPPASARLAQEVRVAGHAILERADALGEQERRLLAATVRQSQTALFISMGVVVALGLLIGQLLTRVVVRPLRRLEAELQPIAEGRFAYFHQVSRDREIVSLTDALNRMLEELELHRRKVLQSEKLASLGVLASGVAHELNNPLGNISNACQILLEELDASGDGGQREWLSQIDTETERARRIVRTLLDYSRRRAFSVERLSLDEVLAKCLTLVRNELPEREAVSLDLPPELVVHGDEQQLQQVFINLIKNAVDAAGASVRIRIGARRSTWQASPPSRQAHLVGDLELPHHEDAPLVVITVADNGPGIPADLLPRVFDPFFTTREPGHGVGLGLYIVEEIIQEHGGCIAVETPAEGGTRFTIWLPCLGQEDRHD